MSYPGFIELFNFRVDSEWCQFGLDPRLAKRCVMTPFLLRRFVEFFHPVAILEDFARLGAVGRADNAILFHQIDQARGTAITDAQAALQSRSRSASGIAHHADGILVEIVVNILAAI